MSEAALIATLVVYYLLAIAAGHLLHELVHVATAYAVGCEDIRVVWPHVYYTGGPLQRLTVALSPLVVGLGALVSWAAFGPWLVSVAGVAVPHPAWFGVIALSATWHDDIGQAKRILGAWWYYGKLLYRGCS